MGRFPEGHASEEDLRPEIAISWWRSQLLGVRPDFPIEAVSSEELLDADERLRRAVQPVLEQLTTKLAGTNSALILADHRPVILDRRGTNRAIETELDRLAVLSGHHFGEGCVGTNGIGTAVEERRLVRVAGTEHYGEIFKHLSCYGVPLIHPLNRRLTGVLNLCFPRADEHPLMTSFMQDAGRQIEGLLAEWASLRERAQFECFLALSRRCRRPVLSTMDDAVLLNRRARDLNPVDQAALLRAAGEIDATAHGAIVSLAIEGQDELVSVRVHTQSEQARFQGIVLEVLPSQPRRSNTRPGGASLPGLVGTSSPWTEFCSQATAAVATGMPILLTGEGGTGKLAVAKALHKLTGRTQLTVVDVATALADGPTVWLRTLRAALDESDGNVVVRHLELSDPALSATIAAEIDRTPGPRTHLFATLAAGTFPEGSQPLLDRFSIQLVVPPLRDRRDDIEALVRCFLSRQATSSPLRFHPEALAILRAAEFPGNVRELERLVTGLAATRRSGDVLVSDLPRLTLAGPAHLSPMERAERDAIVKALQLAKGNKASAAAALGIARQTLYRKITVYGVEPG